MGRKRVISPQHARQFEGWCAALAAGRLSKRTADCYKTDVARFLRDSGDRSLNDCCDTGYIREYLAKLTLPARRRMMSSLSEFFDYYAQANEIAGDLLRSLKYGRDGLDRQLDFFHLLTKDGLKQQVAKAVSWADFVAPLIESRDKATTIRVGRKIVPLRHSTWAILEAEFRRLSARTELKELLLRQIA